MCLEGRSGGQTLQGGTGSGEDLILESTSHATKGQIEVGREPSNIPLIVVDEATGRVGLSKLPANLEGALDLYLGGRCNNGDPCADDSECTGSCNDITPAIIFRSSGEVSGGGVLMTFVADPDTGLSGSTKRLADVRVNAVSGAVDPNPLQGFIQIFTNRGDLLRESFRLGSRGNFAVNASGEAMIAPTGTVHLRDGGQCDDGTPCTDDSECTGSCTARPVRVDFYHSDTVDNDLSARLEAECTTLTSGAEDCELSVFIQENGAAVERRLRIGPGVTVGSINTDTITFTTDGTAAGEINMTPLATPSINEAVQVDSTGGLLRDGKVAVNAAIDDHDIAIYDSASGDYEDCGLSADFDVSTPPGCLMSLDPSVSKLGTCVGDVSTEFCFQTDLGNREVDMGAVQRWEQPHAADDGCDADSDCNTGFSCKGGTCATSATSGEGLMCDVDADCTGGSAGVCEGNRCEPTALGVTQNQTTENVIAVGVGTRAERYVPGPFRSRIGGVELNNNFFYDGEGGCSTTTTTACDEDSDCPATETCGCSAADTCRGGLCTGSAGSGTCELQLNSNALTAYSSMTGSPGFTAFELDVFDLNVTRGTVTVADPTTRTDARFGIPVMFYVTNNAFIDEENGDVLFDFAGKGGRPAYATAASSCSNNQPGKLGASTWRAATGDQAAPGGSCADGNNGQDSQLVATDYRYGAPVLVVGGGGGMIPGSNQQPVQILTEHSGLMLAGGAGGSAGSCPTTGCTGTPGDGGYGGGALYLEVGNEFRCDDNGESGPDDDEFDFSGESPTTDEGGAGGGGGGLTVYARRLGSFSACEFDNSGGTGDTAPGTCCDGGDGGAGANYLVEVPM